MYCDHAPVHRQIPLDPEALLLCRCVSNLSGGLLLTDHDCSGMRSLALSNIPLVREDEPVPECLRAGVGKGVLFPALPSSFRSVLL